MPDRLQGRPGAAVRAVFLPSFASGEAVDSPLTNPSSADRNQLTNWTRPLSLSARTPGQPDPRHRIRPQSFRCETTSHKLYLSEVAFECDLLLRCRRDVAVIAAVVDLNC